MFLANLVRYFTQLCPRSFSPSALIMLGGKAQTVIQIRIVENDMAMQVVFIIVDGRSHTDNRLSDNDRKVPHRSA